MTEKAWMKKHTKILDADLFQEVYCESCGICLSSASHPVFCFDTVYRDNPEGFNDMVYAKLCRLGGFEVESQQSRDDFKSVFCNDELCSEAIIANPGSIFQDECANFEACYNTFITQVTEFSDEDVENDTEEFDAGLEALENIRERYGDIDDGSTVLSPSAKNIIQTPLPASPDSQYMDEAEENEFFWMAYGMSKKQYYNKPKSPTKNNITVFTNKNAKWTQTLKKIFGTK